MVPNDPARIGNGVANHRKPCKLCGHTADVRDVTNEGYHIDCAKEVADFVMDELHGGNGMVFREWYRKRYPGRLIPVRATGRQAGQTGE